jgi:hypothetical protein
MSSSSFFFTSRNLRLQLTELATLALVGALRYQLKRKNQVFDIFVVVTLFAGETTKPIQAKVGTVFPSAAYILQPHNRSQSPLTAFEG